MGDNEINFAEYYGQKSAYHHKDSIEKASEDTLNHIGDATGMVRAVFYSVL